MTIPTNQPTETKAAELREIDARIAAELFGFEWMRDQHNVAFLVVPADGSFGRRANYDPKHVIPVAGHETEYERYAEWDYDVPRFTASIADSWLIVGKMAERGYWFDFHTPWRPGDKFFGGFTPHGMTGWNGRPDFAEPMGTDTAEEAICRAAIAYLDHARSENASAENKGIKVAK